MSHDSQYYAFESAFSVNNFVTGVSLIILSLTIQFIRTGLVREEYEKALGALIGSIGIHCLLVAFNAPSTIQVCVDAVMTLLAAGVGAVVCYDAIRESWPAIVAKFKRG